MFGYFLSEEEGVMAQRSRLPDGLVEGGTEQLAAVLTEAHTRHTFTVGALEPPQALPTLDLPHLYTHTSNAASECYQFRNKDGIPGSEVTGQSLQNYNVKVMPAVAGLNYLHCSRG